MKGIKDKIVIVTGGNKGIGKAIVKNFLEEGAGAVIAVGGHDTAATEATIKEFSPLGKIEGLTVDVTVDEEVEKMMAYVAEKYGRIDILVNNAGICPRDWATDFDLDVWNKCLDLNMRSYFVCSRTAARYMKEQGGGSIVCISSAASTEFMTKRSAYSVSKAAVNGMVGTLSVEWGRFGIRVNAVAPGSVLTDLVQKGIDDGVIDMSKNMSLFPIKRLIEPEEIAHPVVFLASDEAVAITGQVLFADMGWSKVAMPEVSDLK